MKYIMANIRVFFVFLTIEQGVKKNKKRPFVVPNLLDKRSLNDVIFYNGNQ